MMQFKYAKVSENNPSFSSYRGIKVLSSLYDKISAEYASPNEEKTSSLYRIHLVRSVPGHLAVSFHDGRQFVVFDAVPQQLRLSNIEQTKLERFVLFEVNDYLKNILAIKTLPHVIHLSFLNPSQSNKRRQKAKSNKTNATKASPIARKLQLLAVHSDGGIIIWNWNQIRYLWHYKIRKILPSPLSDAISRQNYINNTNNTLYEKGRPGILVFCSVIPSPPHLIKIPCLNKEKSETDAMYIREFETLLYPEKNIFIRSNTGSIALPSSSSSTSPFSGHVNHEGSLYFLMIDYMMGDEDMINKSNVYDIHRYLLSHHFPGIKTQSTLSTRFIISRVRLDVDYKNINTPQINNKDQSKFADFRILMDGLEEIDFWSEYYKEDKEEEYRRRVIMIIENVWTTRYGFIIEMTVRRTNNIRKMTSASMMSSASNTSSQAMYDVDLAEICIEKRLLYYVSPHMNQMKRIPFPSTKLTQKDYQKQKDDKIRKNKQTLNAQHLEETEEKEKEDISFIDSAKQEINRFMIGQHGTTKQLLLWDRFNNSFYILDENQLPPSSLSEYKHFYHKNKADQYAKHKDKLSAESLKHLTPKFDLPFGHFSDRSRRIEWKYICRFDVPNESFYDPTLIVTDHSISTKYKACNERLKIWGYHDWICINITHDVYYIHLTNIVLHRRYLFHQYKHHKQQQNDIKKDDDDNIRLQFPSPIYLSPLYREIDANVPQRHRSFSSNTAQRRSFSYSDQKEKENDNINCILSCAISSLPRFLSSVTDYCVICDFGICSGDGIFRLNMPHLHEQVDAVNSCYSECQSVLGGLNLLSRWGQTSLIARSKYLTDFLFQQSVFNDSIKSAQIKEALKIAPFPLLTALLYKYPQFDSLLLHHYRRVRDDFPKFIFNYGRIFGKSVMQNILYYMDHIYKNQPPLPILNRDKECKLLNNGIPSFIAQDLAILSGQITMDDEEEDIGILMENTSLIHAIERNENGNKRDNDNGDLVVDIDQIRTLVSSRLPSDLDLLESLLKLDGIRDDPFDPATFETNPQFLCRILLLPASFRSSDKIEVTTPLNLLSSLCRFYDLIYPVATFRLIQLLCHYQGTSSNKIALSAYQGLSDVKHDLHEIPDTLIMEMNKNEQFDLFEKRIVSRVFLCKIAHRYYDMLDNLLMTPLTVSRLNNAIKSCKRFHDKLSDIQKVGIFKRLLSAWIQVKQNTKNIDTDNDDIDIGSEWIIQLRPQGYNGFHFMEHITQEIQHRKEQKIAQLTKNIEKNNCDKSKKELERILKGEIPMLAGKDDIPVSVLRPVLMFFASQMHPHR